MLKSCEYCHQEYKTSNSKSKFCSLSCFGKVNGAKNPNVNVNRCSSPQPPKFCKNCGKPLPLRPNKLYCDRQCHGAHRGLVILAQAEDTGIAPSHPKTLKKVVLATQPHQCSICKGTEWQGHPMPLEVDHIDGNSSNNQLTNLRLVCGNCGMQLPTYKGRNKGSGRYTRRQRYAAGQSY